MPTYTSLSSKPYTLNSASLRLSVLPGNLYRITNSSANTITVASSNGGDAIATLATVAAATTHVFTTTTGQVLITGTGGSTFTWELVSVATETDTVDPYIGPSTFTGTRALDLYPTKCAFQVDPKLACLTYPASDPSPVLASTYVLAADTETVMGVIDSGSRNTLMYQGTAGNRLVVNADALTVTGRNGATQNIPGLTGAVAGKSVETPASPFANVVAEGGFTMFAATKDAYRAGLNVFAYNGNAGTSVYFARNAHGVTTFLGTGLAVDYSSAVPDDLYIMAVVYDRAAGTLKQYHGTGLTKTHTGIAAFTPSTTALQIGGAPALASLGLQGDLLWFSFFEGALPDAVVRDELEALNWQFGVRGNLIVCHSNSFGLIAHNTSNNTVEHCFPAKIASHIADAVTVKSFATSGVLTSALTTAFPTAVNPWNATSRANQFLVLCEGTNSLQTAIAADPATAVASVISQWTAYGTLADSEGWNTILIGIPSRSIAGTEAGFNTYAEELNAYARANYESMGFAGFVDLWADSILGGSTGSTNTTYFFDGLHPTPAGHSRIARLTANVINDLWVTAAN